MSLRLRMPLIMINLLIKSLPVSKKKYWNILYLGALKYVHYTANFHSSEFALWTDLYSVNM